jgi:hypothetical protein
MGNFAETPAQGEQVNPNTAVIVINPRDNPDIVAIKNEIIKLTTMLPPGLLPVMPI